jgi:hypothetical protein
VKVLHIQKVKGIGGSERHLFDLLNGLANVGVDSRLVVLSAPGSEPFLDILAERGLRFEVVEAGRDINVSVWFRLPHNTPSWPRPKGPSIISRSGRGARHLSHRSDDSQQAEAPGENAVGRPGRRGNAARWVLPRVRPRGARHLVATRSREVQTD